LIWSTIRTTALLLCFAAVLESQQSGPPARPRGADVVEKLGNGLFRIGNIRVDTVKKEISVAGKVNDAPTLEFIAGTKGGAKKYETALELDTNAVMFNMALILIGLDKANGVPTKFHFDPTPPKGDPVDIWVEWDAKDGHHRVPAEEVVWNKETKQPLAAGQWVYTGSVVLADGQYLADMDGVLVGFVHTPAPIIDRSSFEKSAYGLLQINPNVGLLPGTAVTVTLSAVPKGRKK